MYINIWFIYLVLAKIGFGSLSVSVGFWFENDIFRVKIKKFLSLLLHNFIDFSSDFQPLTDTSKNSGKKSKDASGGGKKKRKNSKKEILIVVSSPNSSDSGEKDSDDVSSHSSRLEMKWKINFTKKILFWLLRNLYFTFRTSSRTESMVSSSKSSTDSSGMGSR